MLLSQMGAYFLSAALQVVVIHAVCVLCIWEGMNSTQQLVLPSFRLFMLDLLCVFQDFLVYVVKSLHSFMCASV